MNNNPTWYILVGNSYQAPPPKWRTKHRVFLFIINLIRNNLRTFCYLAKFLLRFGRNYGTTRKINSTISNDLSWGGGGQWKDVTCERNSNENCVKIPTCAFKKFKTYFRNSNPETLLFFFRITETANRFPMLRRDLSTYKSTYAI